MKRPSEVEGTAVPSREGVVRPSTYDASQIEVLDGLGAVRKRPGMYVGNVHDGSGLHHLVWEVVGNVIDQHLARRARRMSVELEGDMLVVEDDGPGIPLAPIPPHGTPALHVVLTTLFGGPTRWGHFPHVHVTRTQHGVGLAPVNALSASFEVEVHQNGGVHRAVYERGCTLVPLLRVGATSRTGTRIAFRPDPTIFSTRWDPSAIEARLRELAWLCPLLEIRWQGAVLPGKGGLPAWLREVAPDAEAVVASTRTIDDVDVDLAIGWRPGGGVPCIASFVGLGLTRDGGTHVNGIWGGLLSGLTPLVSHHTRHDLRARIEKGLVVLVNVGLLHPRFHSPTTDRLDSPEAAKATRRAVEEALSLALAPGTATRAWLAQHLA